jgi:nucleotide-binding universal stress UspA family protein
MLVPLDMTPEGEAALRFVADAARGGGATVRLLHVAPTPDNVVSAEGRIVAFADQELARMEAEALDYLRTIEARLEGAAVETAIRFGEAVHEILREAEEFEADVIVLTTGYHRTLNRLILGSTAEQVCRKTEVDVVMFRPGAAA